MSFLKNNPEYKLYYTDTDSWFINKPLPEHMVGTKFGQFKLENVIKRAVFRCSKERQQGKEAQEVSMRRGDNLYKIYVLHPCGQEPKDNIYYFLYNIKLNTRKKVFK